MVLEPSEFFTFSDDFFKKAKTVAVKTTGVVAHGVSSAAEVLVASALAITVGACVQFTVNVSTISTLKVSAGGIGPTEPAMIRAQPVIDHQPTIASERGGGEFPSCDLHWASAKLVLAAEGLDLDVILNRAAENLGKSKGWATTLPSVEDLTDEV